MNQSSQDLFNEMFGKFITGENGKNYHCTFCKYSMEKILIKTTVHAIRKLFFCKNKKCDRFGAVTVVAIIK